MKQKINKFNDSVCQIKVALFISGTVKTFRNLSVLIIDTETLRTAKFNYFYCRT